MNLSFVCGVFVRAGAWLVFLFRVGDRRAFPWRGNSEIALVRFAPSRALGGGMIFGLLLFGRVQCFYSFGEFHTRGGDGFGRVIPHEFIVFGPMASQINSVGSGIKVVCPVVAAHFEKVWELPEPDATS